MTYDRFLKIGLELQKVQRVSNKLYDNGMDLTTFTNPYYTIISELLSEVYGDMGRDWFTWFCYENDFGAGGLTTYDKEGKEICYSFKSLYEYVELETNRQTSGYSQAEGTADNQPKTTLSTNTNNNG